MLKAKVTKETTELEIMGTLPNICTDLTNMMRAINKRLSERDHELGHEFRVVFTKAFMDGVMFEDDREHMEHYLAEADEKEKKCKEKLGDFNKFLDDFINWLKEKNEALEKFNKAFEDAEREKDDEAE